jgi:hypothetical protein
MANGYQPQQGETWGKANTTAAAPRLAQQTRNTQPIFFYRFFLQPKE